MFDEMERLRSDTNLFALLAHYARLGEAKREVWNGRLMTMAELRPSEMTKLHGDLLSFAWVELHTGHVPTCYRITLQGQRAFAKAQLRIDDEEEVDTPNPIEKAA